MEEKNQSICTNPWCKGIYYYTSEECPKQCPKCASFDNDLSGGVSWNTKKYDGPRWDGKAHEINYKTTNYK